MRLLLVPLVLIVVFQNCGGNEFDVSLLPSRPYFTSELIDVEEITFVEGGSEVVVIKPKFELSRTYYFTWEIIPQGQANLADISPQKGQIELGPGLNSFELPIASVENSAADGTRRFIIEFTLVSGDNSFKTSAEIFLTDND
ncbi:MAG: hypothetical protein SGJ18_10570 [Pseudomonadota bacterium]|nr:hypothetical protein [Pseudomonadota bacterium]